MNDCACKVCATFLTSSVVMETIKQILFACPCLVIGMVLTLDAQRLFLSSVTWLWTQCTRCGRVFATCALDDSYPDWRRQFYSLWSKYAGCTFVKLSHECAELHPTTAKKNVLIMLRAQSWTLGEVAQNKKRIWIQYLRIHSWWIGRRYTCVSASFLLLVTRLLSV